MEYPALEKFMPAMGITYEIEPDRFGEASGVYEELCIHMSVFYRGSIELDQYRC